MKNDDSPTREEFVNNEQAPSVVKLTQENLKKVDELSQKASAAPKPASKKAKRGAAKPAWAVTEKQQVQA